MRAPVVAGVAGGVGVTTVALALHAREAGREVGRADVVVCRSSAESLARADRVAERLDPAGPLPVLAVTVDGGLRLRPKPARFAEAGAGWSAVVFLPYVHRWSEVDDPYQEADGLLGEPPAEVPRVLRGYATGIRTLAHAVARSGRLTSGAARTALPGPAVRSLPSPAVAALPPDGPAVLRGPGVAGAGDHIAPVRRLLAPPRRGAAAPSIGATDQAAVVRSPVPTMFVSRGVTLQTRTPAAPSGETPPARPPTGYPVAHRAAGAEAAPARHATGHPVTHSAADAEAAPAGHVIGCPITHPAADAGALPVRPGSGETERTQGRPDGLPARPAPLGSAAKPGERRSTIWPELRAVRGISLLPPVRAGQAG